MTATHEGQKRAAAASSEKLNERGGPYSAFRGKTNARTDRTVPTFPAANDRFRRPDGSCLPQVRHAEERRAVTPCRNPNAPKRVVYRLRLKICP